MEFASRFWTETARLQRDDLGEELRAFWSSRATAVQQGSQDTSLPVLVYYAPRATARSAQSVGLVGASTQVRIGDHFMAGGPLSRLPSRWDGYLELYGRPDVEALHSWLYRQTAIELQEGGPAAQLRAVQNAVCGVVPGAKSFQFHMRTQEIRVTFADETIPFFLLSDGYRHLLSVVADIARRAAVLNPQLGNDVASAPGVICIDEVELHLHPRWQRDLLARIRSTFPNMQIIAASHSPQVISNVRRESVRVLDSGRICEARPTYGRDANAVLEDIFGVPARPDAVEGRLRAMSSAIAQDAWEVAEKNYQELLPDLGADDPAMLAARFEIDLGADDASL